MSDPEPIVERVFRMMPDAPIAPKDLVARVMWKYRWMTENQVRGAIWWLIDRGRIDPDKRLKLVRRSAEDSRVAAPEDRG